MALWGEGSLWDCGLECGHGHDFNTRPLTYYPPPLARHTPHATRRTITRNVAKKKELEEQLEKQQETMRPAEQRMVQLMAEVDTQSRRARHAHGAAKQLQAKLAKAEQQMAMVEIQKLELEQAQVVQEGMMRERELALQKVELQVQVSVGGWVGWVGVRVQGRMVAMVGCRRAKVGTR